MIKQINQLRKFIDVNFTEDKECASYEIIKGEIITSGSAFVKQCYKHGFFRDFNLKVSTEDEFGFRLIIEYGYPPSVAKKWKSNLKKAKPAKKPLKKGKKWNWVEQHATQTTPTIEVTYPKPKFPIKPIPVDWIAIENDFHDEIITSDDLVKAMDKIIDEGTKKDPLILAQAEKMVNGLDLNSII